MGNIEKLIRYDLKNLSPYEVMPRGEGQIWLDMNELPWQVTATDQNLNRYPLVNQELTVQLAKAYQVKANQLCLTRGSDDAIDLLMRLFCQSYQDNIVICPPTFSMYSIYAKLQGVKVISVPLRVENNFALNVSSIKASIQPEIKLIFICSPNNPTGTLANARDILEICEYVKDKAIVIVDEAYQEFAKTQSMSTYLNAYPNLVVLRTLSKALGLAAVRCGVVLANQSIIKYLQAIMPPYALTQSTISFVSFTFAPSYKDKVECYIQRILSERKRLLTFFKNLPWVEKSWDSEANFILIRVKDADYIAAVCLKSGILIKNLNGKPFLDNCLRISVGTEEQNQQLMQTLSKMSVPC